MDKLLAGLILAAISGLTFLAYRHPKAYDKLFHPLIYCTVGTFTALNIFNCGYTFGRYHKDSDPFPFPFGWVFGGCLFAYLYFAFLAQLPLLLEHDPKKEKEPHDEA